MKKEFTYLKYDFQYLTKFRGAIPGGAQGAQAPPKLGGRKLRILQKGGLKPPQYSSHAGKMTLFKPFRTSLSKEIFETPQYLAPNGAPATASSRHV